MPARGETAAVHFERALEALKLVESGRGKIVGSEAAGVPRERGEWIVALARARWSAGLTEDARKSFLDATRVARQVGDAEVLAQAALGFVGRSDVTPGVDYASTARHFSCQRPDIAPQTRIVLADRAISLTDSGPASEVQALAIQERLVDLFEMGDGDAFYDWVDFGTFLTGLNLFRNPIRRRRVLQVRLGLFEEASDATPAMAVDVFEFSPGEMGGGEQTCDQAHNEKKIA